MTSESVDDHKFLNFVDGNSGAANDEDYFSHTRTGVAVVRTTEVEATRTYFFSKYA